MYLLKQIIALLTLLLISASSYAQSSCRNLFDIGPVSEVDLETLSFAYPKVFETVELMRAQILSSNKARQARTAQKIPFKRSNGRTQLAKASTSVQEAMRDVYNRLQDPKSLSNFLSQRMLEAAIQQAKSGSEKDVASLKEGQVRQVHFLRVMNAYVMAQGYSIMVMPSRRSIKMQELKKQGLSENDMFRSAIKKGVIYDKGFIKGDLHGRATHLVQVAYVMGVIYNATNGKPQEFWDFIGSKQGIWFWYDLFDSMTNNPTRPEYFSTLLRPQVPLP